MLIAALFWSVSLSVQAAEDPTLKHPDRVIAEGIRIGGEDVSGLTEQEAADRLEQQLAEKGSALIVLSDEEGNVQAPVRASELGLSLQDYSAVEKAGEYGRGHNIIARYKARKDLQQNGGNIDPGFSFNKDTIRSVVQQNSSQFTQEARDGSLTRSGGEFQIVGGQKGQTVDEEGSVDKIYTYLTEEWDGGNAQITLALNITEPKGDTESLMKVKDLLGTYTTNYSSSGQNRCNNVANGTRLCNGTVLYPGEQFSVLQHITPFTEENGYYLAGSYLGSQVVESFGGGICQVSTTLYNAVILAELQVNERYNHSLIVNYVKPSMDAAIAESSGMDFKFTNNTDYPIYIEGYTADKNVTFNVWGVETRDPGRKVSFESETLEVIEPTGEKVYTDSTKPVGYTSTSSAHTGYRAQLWKVVTQDGTQVSREVFNTSYYNPAPVSMTVGTAGEVSDSLRAAINANSIEGVKTVLAGGTYGEADQTTADQALADAATQAAQDAYAAALAQGTDEATAMAQAQQAAEGLVEQQTADAQVQAADQAAAEADAAAAQTTEAQAAETDAPAQ